MLGVTIYIEHLCKSYCYFNWIGLYVILKWLPTIFIQQNIKVQLIEIFVLFFQ